MIIALDGLAVTLMVDRPACERRLAWPLVGKLIGVQVDLAASHVVVVAVVGRQPRLAPSHYERASEQESERASERQARVHSTTSEQRPIEREQLLLLLLRKQHTAAPTGWLYLYQLA